MFLKGLMFGAGCVVGSGLLVTILFGIAVLASKANEWALRFLPVRRKQEERLPELSSQAKLAEPNTFNELPLNGEDARERRAVCHNLRRRRGSDAFRAAPLF
jgi:hypothetical protein